VERGDGVIGICYRRHALATVRIATVLSSIASFDAMTSLRTGVLTVHCLSQIPMPHLRSTQQGCRTNALQPLHISLYYILASMTSAMEYIPAPLPAKNLAACTAPLPNTALEYAV